MTPDVATCEQIIHAALREGDMKAVKAALLIMAPQDPDRAEELRQMLLLAIATAWWQS